MERHALFSIRDKPRLARYGSMVMHLILEIWGSFQASWKIALHSLDTALEGSMFEGICI